MPHGSYWGVRISVFGRSNFATIAPGGFLNDQNAGHQRQEKMRKQDTRKRGSIVYPGSRKRKFFSLNPASPGPTQSNFLLLAG